MDLDFFCKDFDFDRFLELEFFFGVFDCFVEVERFGSDLERDLDWL